MNRMTEWNVGGTLVNGEKFAVVVSALYGYSAMKKATAIVGKIKAGSAVRIEPEQVAECSRCGKEVLPSKHGSFGCGS